MDGFADTFNERRGVEVGADDLVGAVSEIVDAPVADEGDELLVLGCLDLGAEMLGLEDAVFTFNIDQTRS